MTDPTKPTKPPTYSPARAIGKLLKAELAKNPEFYFFSPDETTSNRLDAVFEASTRAWNLPRSDWDLPASTDGRIIEMLAENVLFSVMTGHILSGGSAMFASYEAFFPIITSQLLQHLKFLDQSSTISWRPDYAAVNLLSTSTCWRQDHNGFSHQSPILISTLLALPSRRVNCLFPIDDVAARATFRFMTSSKNVVNLTTFNKTLQPRWLDTETANPQLTDGGATIYIPVSDKNPDFVFTAAGDIVSCEAIAAMKILREDLPDLKLRFVNLAALSYNAIGTTDHPLTTQGFNQLFTTDKPIIANFHGYPETLRTILSHYTTPDRLYVHGFIEKGSTTTPFQMLSLNQASRYHLALDVVTQLDRKDLISKYKNLLAINARHAATFGVDMIQ